MGSFPMGAWLGEEIETERRKFEVLREEKAEMEMENEPWTLAIRPWYESWVSPSPVSSLGRWVTDFWSNHRIVFMTRPTG